MDRSYFYNQYYNEFILEAAGDWYGKLRKGGLARNLMAGGLRQTRKGRDRAALTALIASPEPITTVLGASLMPLSNRTRARIYLRTIKNPIKAARDAPGAFVRGAKDLLNKRKNKVPAGAAPIPA